MISYELCKIYSSDEIRSSSQTTALRDLVGCAAFARVCIKIEIHEIHENLRNPVSINRNPLSVTKSTWTERKLIIEIQYCSSVN